MDKDVLIEQNIIDTLIERPYEFAINGTRFFLYPPTFGKIQLCMRILADGGIDANSALVNPYQTALNYILANTDDACRILAYHTMRNKYSLFNETKVSKRMEFFKNSLSVEELTSLFMLTLTFDNVATFCKHLGIDKEKEAMMKVLKAKKENGNTFTFGGKSVWGAMIDVLCERYHWTLDYIMWGISYSNIRMLLEDKVNTIYLTDEEMKRCRVPNDRTFINADDKNNIELIKAMFK